MTRDVGQLTPAKTVFGLVLATIIAAAVVALLDGLIHAREVPLDAPGQNVARTCEELTNGSPRVPLEVTSIELIECPRFYDGQRVRYAGEVVRAVLRRGDRAWVQLNDDPYGMGIGPLPEHRTAVGGNSGIPVSVPAGAVDRITHVGDHTHLGDVLEVEGVFLRADPSDGGGPAIRADTVAVERVGRAVPAPLPLDRAVVAGGLLLAAVTFYWLGLSGRRGR